MKYLYRCENGEEFDVQSPIHVGPPKDVTCPVCGKAARHVFLSSPIHYNAQGFHTTDYDKNGDKLEWLNKNWSKFYGEDPPPPGTKIPKSSSEKH